MGTTQNSMMRFIFGIKIKSYINTKTIRNNVPNVRNCFSAGHITFWFLKNKTRRQGKANDRWRDEVHRFLKNIRVKEVTEFSF